MISGSIDKKTLSASTLGNTLEFYDFTLYAFFIPLLAPYFFPATDDLSSTISTLAVFAVGFLARPIGAIVFGYIGDIHGRKKALSLSIFGMAVPTVVIGILPSYDQIGLWAPILLAACRLTQGFCAGGEYNGAGIFVVEHAKKDKGFLGSILTSAGSIGAFIASVVAYICVQPWVPTWSWRIAFLMGGLIGIIGFYLRRNIADTPEFKKSMPVKGYMPITIVLKQFCKKFFYCISIGGMAVAPFYYVLSFFNPYLVLSKTITLQQMMLENTIYVLLASLSVVLWGRYCDRIGLRKSMRFAAAMILLSATGLFFASTPLVLTMFKALLVITSGFFAAPTNAYMSSLFPVKYRYSGVSLGYCLGMVLGGSVPYLSGILTKGLGNVSYSICTIFFVYLFYFFMDWKTGHQIENPSKKASMAS